MTGGVSLLYLIHILTENGIDYILVGDYYIPDLKLPEEHRPIGKYGRDVYKRQTLPSG